MTDIAAMKQQARATWAAGDFDAVVPYFMDHFGPMVMARRELEPTGRWEEFLQAYREVCRRWDQGEAGSAALPVPYLLVTGTRRG